MAPILGIFASQISGHLWAPSGAYDSIATVTVGAGGASSIAFSSIPSTYTHLQIRGILGVASAGTTNYLQMTYNGVGGTSYSGHVLFGNGSSAGANAGNGASSSSIFAGSVSNATTTFGGVVVDILDYANTSKYKTSRHLVGMDSNGSGSMELISGLFMNTSAISSITFTGSTNFPQYSTLALYGIKGN
jgi:hypothetical protein